MSSDAPLQAEVVSVNDNGYDNGKSNELAVNQNKGHHDSNGENLNTLPVKDAQKQMRTKMDEEQCWLRMRKMYE